MEFRVLELFSGIGGMHSALEYSGVPGKVMTAIDINTVANEVYKHNHPNTPLQNKNIQNLSPKTVEKLKANTLLMSPPCQPHTRVGNQRDTEDRRSDALNHLCELLPACTGLRYVLMENVKGFEKSQARHSFIAALESAGYFWRELLLSPTHFGVPNTRHRYYCVARKSKDFDFNGEEICLQVPAQWQLNVKQLLLHDILEPATQVPAETQLPDKVLLRHVGVLDVVSDEDSNTMCFTKAYTHYAEGTGSVYTPLKPAEREAFFVQAKTKSDETDRLSLLQSLRLRYFTPCEVARLMCFPDAFDFPASITQRQRYRLLGNSINVRVVGELLKVLLLDM